MDIFYFGPSAASLLGCYHPPQQLSRHEGVVLCNPFGQEYLRAHRSLRRLAESLAEQGYAVLRFDYRGTGDSAGDMAGVTADDWVADIQLAVRELMDVAAVSRVSLVGLRLGALLAAQAARHIPAVSRLLLWDPIVSGHRYVDEIQHEIAGVSQLGARANFVAPDGAIYFNGFVMPRSFQDSLMPLNLAGLDGLERLAVAQMVSHHSDDFAQLETWLRRLPRFHYQFAEAPHDWNYVDHVGGILWPRPILAAIDDYFSVKDL